MTNMGKAYREFLNSPEWKAISSLRKEMDGNQCTVCGSTEKLEVHHIKYENDKRYGILRLANLTTLCRKCHQEEHSGPMWCCHCAYGKRLYTPDGSKIYLCVQEKSDGFAEDHEACDGCEYFEPWPFNPNKRTHWSIEQCMEHIREIKESK